MKTQIADFLFLYNTIKQVVDNNLNIRLKIYYFTLEMTAEEKMLSAFSNILYLKEGVRISPTDLKSTKADRVLSAEHLELIKKYQKYFEKIEEVVTFVDNIRNPFGIFNMLREHARANGTQHKKKVQFKNNKTGEVTTKEIDDYYEPDDPDEYVICLVDHVSLISQERENGRMLSLHESISKLSSNYLVQLRNKYNYIPVVVQQQSAASESLDNFKANKLKPSLNDLGDNKLTGRDANLILGLFSPFRHEIKNYLGYNIEKFRDNIRFLEIIGGRQGGGGTVCPLYFDGAVNFFKELPTPEDTKGINQVYEFLKTIRRGK